MLFKRYLFIVLISFLQNIGKEMCYFCFSFCSVFINWIFFLLNIRKEIRYHYFDTVLFFIDEYRKRNMLLLFYFLFYFYCFGFFSAKYQKGNVYFLF